MRSATKIGCAAIAALTCAGSAAAALPSPPEPPVLPALPALPVPVPQAPVELPPVPSPPVPAPTPSLPVAPTVDAPSAGVAAQPAAATVTGLSGRTPSATNDSRASSSAATSPPETSIRSGKIRRTGRNVEIPYVLARSGRVFVVLRGPLPSCTFVARFSVRGQRGPNVLRFDGTVGRERLLSGTYLIGLRTAASSVRWKLLAISRDAVRPVRRSAAPIVRACAEPTALAELVSSESSGTPGERGRALSPNASAAPQPPVDRPLDEDLRPSVLPFVGVEEAIGELPTAAGVLLVLLLLGSLAGITAFVVRFIRAT